MRGGLTKGLIVGSIVGASLGMMMEGNGVKRRRNKIVRNGRKFIKASSDMIDDLFR